MIHVLISLSVHRTMTALPAPSCFLAGPQHLTRSEPLPIKRDIPQLIVGKAPSGILSKMKSHPEPPSPPNSVLLPVGVGWVVNRNSFINPKAMHDAEWANCRIRDEKVGAGESVGTL
jgi:hypothetical protein